jgi:two-component system, NarL family, response regulator NreC
VAHPGDDIEIVLADDHTMVRRGLRMVLDSEEGLTVVAEAGDIDAALRARNPRVVVLDLNMPGEPTLPAIPRFLEAAPGAAVVVLTMETDPAFARRALAAGASGYLLKEGADDELVNAVRAVAGGATIWIRGSAAASPPKTEPTSRSAACSPAIASRGSRAGAAWAWCTSRRT